MGASQHVESLKAALKNAGETEQTIKSIVTNEVRARLISYAKEAGHCGRLNRQ